MQHAVSLNDTTCTLIESRLVQWMRKLADETSHRFTRKTRVCIQCDDVANIGGKVLRCAIDKGRVGRTA